MMIEKSKILIKLILAWFWSIFMLYGQVLMVCIIPWLIYWWVMVGKFNLPYLNLLEFTSIIIMFRIIFFNINNKPNGTNKS